MNEVDEGVDEERDEESEARGGRELFDGGRDPLEWSPAIEAELDRRVYAAIGANRRREARRRTIKRAAGVALLAAGVAGAILGGRAIYGGGPDTPVVVGKAAPGAPAPVASGLGAELAVPTSSDPTLSGLATAPAPKREPLVVGEVPKAAAPPPRPLRVGSGVPQSPRR